MKVARERKQLSVKELARRSGLVDSTIGRIERGDTAAPTPELLDALANALELDLADLYVAAGYARPTQLPTFAPYLRSKYANLPNEARAELEASFARIAAKHGYHADGPAPGQDETD
ncbi:helix-turn-helix transcriptional regulator [Nocardioides sp. LHD-245]|uniref:helix-turn-helix domain-containing protein n=1 Tax=Nocardioides sp. LHD-245 TaxID=3051387 RepID=UPI0027E01555|nr:helix-turn-helix transcriptional regulator [Nocardioides sp. LHD-245]